ncbi:MAG: hypothetical protein KF819_09800 [Labilithrix sp.]|nr:hypothetical protein [Labilithrix sp.]
MKIEKTRFLLLTTGIAALVASCDSHPSDEHGASSGGHSSQFPSCDVIIKACHEKDVGAGPVNDCHSLAHDAKSDDECAPKKDACLKTCADADAGAADAAQDG